MSLGFVNNAITSLKNNAKMLSGRKTLADRKTGSGSAYSSFQDYKEMKGHEFAEFQKRMFADKARERRRFRRIFWSVMIVVIAAAIYLLFFYEVGPIKSFKWPV